jgi:hypothetical protein
MQQTKYNAVMQMLITLQMQQSNIFTAKNGIQAKLHVQLNYTSAAGNAAKIGIVKSLT